MKKILFLILAFFWVINRIDLSAQYSKLKIDTITKYRNPNRVFIKDTLNAIFNGNRTVTRSGLPAINTGTTNLIDFLNAYFFPSTSPTATIAMFGFSTSQEMTLAGGQVTNVLWSVTRPVACTPLVSTVVDGTTIAPNPNPAEGGSVSNTKSVNVTNNTTNTYSMTVTSSDGKTGTASVSVNFYWKRYFGCFNTVTVPTTGNTSWISNAQILALSGSEFATSYAKNFGSVNCSSTYYVYAFPHSFGTPTFLVNTFPTTFVQVWVNQPFTNASSGTTNYDVWVSPFPYAGAFTLVAQ